MTLIIHGAYYSTCTQRILTTLAELGVDDWKLELVDLKTGAHKHPDFLKIQPFGQIPTLTDGDLTIYESRAVARYLTEKFAEQGHALFGKSVADRALTNQWWEVESQSFNPAAASITFQIVFAPMFGVTTDPAVVAEQEAKLAKVLDVYEARLSSSKYLAGDFFSIADLSHLPYGNMLVNAAGKAELFASRPHVNAWWKDISSRPSFVKVLALQAH